MDRSRPTPHRRVAAGPAAAALAVVLAMPLGLVACSPAAVPASPSGPASPEPVAPTGGTADEPSPSPEAYRAALGAFVDAVTSGSMTYRVTFTGRAAGSADVIPIEGTLDVSGTDFAASFTYDFGAEYADLGSYKVQVRGVGGAGWIRRAGGDWKSIKGFDIDDSYVPFKAITSTASIKYLGDDEVGGATLHRVGIPGSLLIHPNTIPFEVRKEKVDQTTLEVLVDDAGRPQAGAWHLRGQARVGEGVGQLQRVVYDLELTFSKVGDEMTIKKP